MPPILYYIFSPSLSSPRKTSLHFKLDHQLFFEGKTLFQGNNRVALSDISEKERSYIYYFVVAFFSPQAKNNAQGTKRSMPSPNTIFPLHSHRLSLAPCESFTIGHPSYTSIYRAIKPWCLLFSNSHFLSLIPSSHPLICSLTAREIATYPLPSD